jgi:hypothetical protein
MSDLRLLRRLAEGTELALSPAERGRATALRDALSHALLADRRLRAGEAAARAVPDDLPPHRDWTWRPAPWAAPADPSAWDAAAPATDLAPGMRLFHDCPLGEIGARQVRGDAPPFALAIDVFAFRGSYLSLAVDLPEAGRAGLRRRHVLRLDLRIASERPSDIYARLNIAQGATTAQLVRSLAVPPAGMAAFADFDLTAVKVDLARAETIWIDLILDAPAANAFVIADLHLSRTPRAEV